MCGDSIVKLNFNFSNSVGASGYKVRWCEACQTTYQYADHPLVWSAEPSPHRWPYQAVTGRMRRDRSGRVVKTATEVGVRAIQDHKVIEWNTCWKCRLSEGADDM